MRFILDCATKKNGRIYLCDIADQCCSSIKRRTYRVHERESEEAGKFINAFRTHTHKPKNLSRTTPVKRDNKTHLFIYLLLLFIRIKSTDNRQIIQCFIRDSFTLLFGAIAIVCVCVWYCHRNTSTALTLPFFSLTHNKNKIENE